MPTRSQTRAGETAPERSTTLTPTLASMRHCGGSVSVVAVALATAGGRFAPRAALGFAAARTVGAGGGAAGGAAAAGPVDAGTVTTASGELVRMTALVGGGVGPTSPNSELVS